MDNKPSKRDPRKLIIAGIIAAGIAAYGIHSYVKGKQFATTDNAQLDGDLLPVRAGVTGYIESIRFQDNQRVSKGDTLIIFSTTELLAKVQQAMAALANARAGLSVSDQRAMASRENAYASVLAAGADKQIVIAAKAALERAKQELQRTSELLAIKAATQEQLEAAQTSVQIASADHLKAQQLVAASQRSSSGMHTIAQAEQEEIPAAQAIVAQREAELAQARELLRRAYVIAPFDGIVTKRAIQPQQYVSAGQSLCAIVDDQHLWVTANFKETQLRDIKTGQDVEINVDAYPGMLLHGKIASFGGATGAKFALIPPDNATGNFIKIAQRFPLKISIAQLPGKGQLYPGMSALVKVKLY
jgi:membrane fusion protein (multidrug efflux system)